MHKPDEALAREMAAFCKQRGEERALHPRRSAIAQAVFGVVVAALLVPRGPCWHH